MDDVYITFFQAVGAPEWHGRSFNALSDSIETGNINALEVPYTLLVTGLQSASAEGFLAAQELIEFLRERESRGCPVFLSFA